MSSNEAIPFGVAGQVGDQLYTLGNKRRKYDIYETGNRSQHYEEQDQDCRHPTNFLAPSFYHWSKSGNQDKNDKDQDQDVTKQEDEIRQAHDKGELQEG